ncbi:hypothetical protein SAMN05444157_0531 [Frankineae bacterium MT45]|nr:hypothetical protein SAMN05444157_0531 [Frankineae bacterium MT45]
MPGRLNDLLVEWVVPLLQEVGFRRSGRKFVLATQDSGGVVVQFRPHDTYTEGGFLLDWSVTSAAGWRCLLETKVAGNTPAVAWGIVRKSVFPVDGFWIVPNSNIWKYPDSDSGVAACGASLARILQTSLVPLWLSLLDPVALEAELNRKPVNTMDLNDGELFWSPIGVWRYVALHIDDGDVGRLSADIRQLQEMVPDDQRLPWFENRLNKRVHAVTTG